MKLAIPFIGAMVAAIDNGLGRSPPMVIAVRVVLI
jgi:hypothetical protein